MQGIEINFDGLVGPTHNYAGLAIGNLASQAFAKNPSHPKAAAKQGLKKMQLLMSLGLVQGVLPPHERPFLPLVRNLGFSGTDQNILKQAHKTCPEIFYACYSSSSMWAANAATVSPSFDTLDGRLHLTPANLINHFHRSLEADTTFKILKKIFSSKDHFVVHPPLPAQAWMSDEGAANHNRFCLEHHQPGVELFVFGQAIFQKQANPPIKYPARQTLEASQAITRRHQLAEHRVLFARQNPLAIDLGVFHNDVIAVANKNVFLLHEQAFENTQQVLQDLQAAADFPIHFLIVQNKELSLEAAVQSYLFNSQLVTLPNGQMLLIAPEESQAKAPYQVIQRLLQDNNPIQSVKFVDCRESMQNGGGPACLRLRVVVSKEAKTALHPEALLDEHRHQTLLKWVDRNYRETLDPKDLRDPLLLEESQRSLDELTQILSLGSIYSFQR